MTDNVTYKKPPKSPVAAGILSGFFPGVGQLYNGEYLKGILFLIIFAGLISLQPHGGQPFPALILAGFYFFQIIEAVQTAKSINLQAQGALGTPAAAAAVSAPVKPAPKSGSVFWGFGLMALGVVFLLANFDILDYDRIFDFWPVLIIVIGLKMIFDYVVKKKD
jgi:hypothetical protein